MGTEEIMLPDVEKAAPMESSEGSAGAGMSNQAQSVTRKTVSFEIPAAASAQASPDGGDAATPAPTAADGRGVLRSKLQKHLELVPLVLRIVTALFTLSALALISSASFTPDDSMSWIPFPDEIKFNNFFYFSYLLTVNVFTCAYAIATIFLSVVLLSRSFSHHVVVVSHSSMFLLDQVLSFLLISAASSAATGIRIEKSTLDSYNMTTDFLNKVYTAVTLTFLAFFVMAALAITSARRAPPKSSQ